MKKLLLLFMILLSAFFIMTLSVYAEGEESDDAFEWRNVRIISGDGEQDGLFTVAGEITEGNNTVLQNPVVYVGIYDSYGQLLDCDSIKYVYGKEIESKSFQKNYDGTMAEYVKLFLWDALIPLSSANSVAISQGIFDGWISDVKDAHIVNLNWSDLNMQFMTPEAGGNGNWWVDGYDTGIPSEDESAMFRIDPISYFVEAIYSGCGLWNKLNHRVDHSDVNEYDYPMKKRELLDGYVRDSDNIYIGSEVCRGALICVEDSVFDTVTLTRGDNNLGYAFLAAKPEIYIQSSKFPNGIAPTYAAGYTRVVHTDKQEVTLRIPDNARYLYIYNNDADKSYAPSAVRFIKSGETDTENDNSIRIATWNIGHFSLGANSDTLITDAAFAGKYAEYYNYINNAIDADVIGLNEYSRMFTPTRKARDTVFGSYPIAFEGDQNFYSCNALYAKAGVTNIEAHEYECNKTADMESPYGIYAKDFYYVTADLAIKGETVKLVLTHLAFYAGSSSPRPPIVQDQMNELIEVFKDYDKVVIMGDWNSAFSNFSLFKNAGYSLANNDSRLGTYINSGPLDNIIYKGVTVSGFALAGTKLSDHNAIYCTLTVE